MFLFPLLPAMFGQVVMMHRCFQIPKDQIMMLLAAMILFSLRQLSLGSTYILS